MNTGVQRFCNTMIFLVSYGKEVKVTNESRFYLSVSKLPWAVQMQDFRHSFGKCRYNAARYKIAENKT